MTSVSLMTELSTRPAVTDQGPSVWGLSIAQLHDSYWAARGVQVVRPGQRLDQQGPKLYLLLRAEHAALTAVKPLLKRLSWSGASTIRVRILDRSDSNYHERIAAGPQGELRGITRHYPRHEAAAGRVVVTTDQRLARAWSALRPGAETWSQLKAMAEPETLATAVSEGRLFSLRSASERLECLGALVEAWKEPGRIISTIYQWKEGVWVHQSARIDPSSRLVPPIWIGADDRIIGSMPLIGPLVVDDAHPCEPPEQVDWGAMTLPNFPLLPSVRKRPTQRLAKRAFDIVMSLAVMAATLPIYPFIMLAIYLEDGRPFFFAHKRQTIGGRDFPCWKFRTMVKNAEKLKAELQKQNVCDGPQFFIERDPRLLRIGQFLRRFQLDELPQFWNVLLGHMSVVGPRPSPDKENQFCPAWREARLSVRPGITGLWQVRRTRLPETDFQEWIRYDLEYVQHQSWRLDLWIIVQTVRKVLQG